MRRLAFGVAALLFTGLVSVSAPSWDAVGATSTTFHPMTPVRLMDTRIGVGGTTFQEGQTKTLTVAGVADVPATATAVALNVTATNPTAFTYVTVWPTGTGVPASSNLNVPVGVTIPNMVTVGVGAGGSISLYNAKGGVDLIVDITGWYDGGFTGITPQRLMDTRIGVGGAAAPFAPAETRNLTVAGVGGVPASGVAAVALNVTVTQPSAATFVTVWPSGASRPGSSNLNVVAGQTIPNMVLVGVGAGGMISLYNEKGSVHVIVDVMGWYGVGTGFTGIQPARLLDTRLGTCGLRLGPGETRTLLVAGAGGVPATGVGGVALNITATQPTAPTFLTVWPHGGSRPGTSNLNVTTGQTIPNMVTVGVGAGGQIDLYNDRGYVEVVVDAMGWFDGVTPAGSLVPCPNAPSPPVGTWDVCHEIPGSITGWEPDIPLGATADLTGYLYVKSIFATNGTTYPFTFRSIAYSTGSSGTSAWKCSVTVQIPVGYGPNQVEPLPSSFPYSQVVVRDASGTIITGWTGILDSKHVRVGGVGIPEYGGDNGLPGTNTLQLQTLQALS